MNLLYVTSSWSTHDARFLSLLQSEGWNCGYWGIHAKTPPQHLGLVATYCENTLPNFEKFDLIFGGPLDLPIVEVLEKLSLPYVGLCWAEEIFYRAPRDHRALEQIQKNLKIAKGLAVDSQAVVQQLKKHECDLPKNQILVPWGIDLTQVPDDSSNQRRNELRTQLGISDTLNLLFTRRWTEACGVMDLLNGFTLALLSNPKMSLTLLGSGPLEESVNQYLRENSLDDKIKIPGQVKEQEIYDYFFASDIYVSPSRSDGTSISLLQAMACKKPVLANNIGGNPEWVSEGGWLVDTENSKEFAEKILEAAETSPSIFQRMGQFNRTLVEDKANWKINGPQLASFLKRFI